MFLADCDIEFFRRVGHIDISPWDDDLLQPASYDLTLGPYWRFPGESEDNRHEMTREGFLLPPGEFLLFHTEQTVTLNARTVEFVCGKSSRAREGFQIEAAGLVDPEFTGELVLEVKNLLPDLNIGSYPDVYRMDNHLRVFPGMKIAQIAFAELRTNATRPYGHEGRNHYQGQKGPVGSRDAS